jgi:CRP-like cAMP-binding protein
MGLALQASVFVPPSGTARHAASAAPAEVGAAAARAAADGHYAQVRAFAGEVLYTAGMPAGHLYVVRDGEVDLYLLRDEKRTVVETLRAGQCFGFEPHLGVQRRLHNAAARTYCELYLIDHAATREAVGTSADLVRGLLETLSQRLAATHEVIARRANFQPDLLVYAQLLALLGAADLGRQAQGMPGGRRRDDPPAGTAPGAGLARPLVQEVFTTARLLFGHSDKHIRHCLAKLAGLHLVRFDDAHGGGKQLVFAPRDIVAQARKLTADDAEQDRLTYEYIGVDEFAALVEAERSQVMRKLAASEYADDIFTFRRAEVLRLLNLKGKRFFVERKIKKPDEFSEIGDLEFADAKSVFAAVAKVDSFALAKAMSVLDEGVAKTKILQCLSQRRRAELEADLADLASVDPVEAQQIGQQIVADVKAAMLARAG